MTTEQPVLAHLAQETLLILEGPDASTFLHGQTTADFRNAESRQVIAGAFCDPKGRVLCDFVALHLQSDSVLLRVHQSVISALEQHLEKFLLFSKATLSHSDRCVFGLCIHNLPTALKSPQPSSQGLAVPFESGFLVERSDHSSQTQDVEYWADKADALVFSEAVACPIQQDSSAWYLRGIDRGEARVTAATWGKYLPQDLNYDLLGRVNFKKGCYTGQEVIARLHWRGSPKRRLYYGIVAGNDLSVPEVLPGSKIIDNLDKARGSVVNAVRISGIDHIAFESTTPESNSPMFIADSGACITNIRAYFDH